MVSTRNSPRLKSRALPWKALSCACWCVVLEVAGKDRARTRGLAWDAAAAGDGGGDSNGGSGRGVVYAPGRGLGKQPDGVRQCHVEPNLAILPDVLQRVIWDPRLLLQLVHRSGDRVPEEKSERKSGPNRRLFSFCSRSRYPERLPGGQSEKNCGSNVSSTLSVLTDASGQNEQRGALG